MHRIHRGLVLALITTAAMAAPAQADNWHHKDRVLRAHIVRLYGHRAPGCDLVEHRCVKHPHPGWRAVHRYFETMRAMLVPKPAATYLTAGAPRQPPAGTATPRAGGTLEAIAACESGGNPATNTGNGFYGKYQFTQSTWESVGGTGNPAAASEAEQDQRAAMLYAREGASPWPVCGR